MKTIQRKTWAVITLSVIVLLSWTSCGTSRKQVHVPQEPRMLHILAVNDMHAAIDNFPRFAFMVDSLRALYPDMLLFSGGDNQTGNPINDQYSPKGLPMIELMNALRFDVSAVGNHEFDCGPEGFRLLLEKASFDFLCANLAPPTGKTYHILPNKTIKMPNGLTVGVTSVLAINTGGIPDTHPDNAVGFTFYDPFETAPKQLAMRDRCDVFIYLNHLGFEEDMALAGQLPKDAADLIIGGHSHTKIDNEQFHHNILITQAENKLKYATLITVKVNPDGTKERHMTLLPVGKKGNEQATVRAMVDKYNDNPAMKELLAEATDEFTSYEQVGYLMADALRDGTKAEIALINHGGVRIEQLSKGAITVRDVYTMDPFGNEAVLFKLTGHELKALFIAAWPLDEELPVYPSGLKTRYVFAADGTVSNVELFMPDGTPADMDRTYTVAMNNYMASVYKYEHQDPGTGLFQPTAENMIRYLKALKTVPSYRNEQRVELKK